MYIYFDKTKLIIALVCLCLVIGAVVLFFMKSSVDSTKQTDAPAVRNEQTTIDDTTGSEPELEDGDIVIDFSAL